MDGVFPPKRKGGGWGWLSTAGAGAGQRSPLGDGSGSANGDGSGQWECERAGGGRTAGALLRHGGTLPLMSDVRTAAVYQGKSVPKGTANGRSPTRITLHSPGLEGQGVVVRGAGHWPLAVGPGACGHAGLRTRSDPGGGVCGCFAAVCRFAVVCNRPSGGVLLPFFAAFTLPPMPRF